MPKLTKRAKFFVRTYGWTVVVTVIIERLRGKNCKLNHFSLFYFKNIKFYLDSVFLFILLDFKTILCEENPILFLFQRRILSVILDRINSQIVKIVNLNDLKLVL